MKRMNALMLGAAGFAMLAGAPMAVAQEAIPTGKNILIVCGNENNTVINCTSIDDITLKNRLELLMGHHVTMIPHNAEAAEMLAAADAADLVIIVESVSSGSVGTKIVSTTTPVLSSEAFLQDEFGLVVGPYHPVDPGYPGGPTAGQIGDAIGMLTDLGFDLGIEVPEVPAPVIPPGADAAAIAAAQSAAEDAAEEAYDAAVDAAIEAAIAANDKPTHGVTVAQSDIMIANPNHPLAAGLSGRVHVYRYAREMNWGVALAPGAEVIATLAPATEAAGDAAQRQGADYRSAAIVYYVPEGGQLANGTAPGLRIQMFVENENGPGTYNLVTEDGFRIFDAAINFGLSGGTSN